MNFTFRFNSFFHYIIPILIISMFIIESGLPIFSTIMYFSILILSVFLKPEQVFYLIALLSPINRVFLYNINGITLIPILIIISLIKYTLKYKKIEVGFIILFLSIFIINLIHATIIEMEVLNTVTFFINLYFAYIVNRNNEKSHFLNFAKYYIVGALISSFGGLIFDYIPNFVQNYRFSEFGFYRFMGLVADSTQFGQKILVAISLTVSMIFIENKKHKLTYFIVLILLVYFLVLSGTRSTIIGMLFILLYSLYNFLNMKNKRINKKKIVITFILLPIVVLLLYIFYLEPIFELRSDSAFLTDRFDIWKSYIEYWTSKADVFLFGIGAGNSIFFSEEFNLLATHNGYLEIIFEFGVIGSLLLLRLIWRYILGRRLFNIFTLPLIIYLTTLFSLSITGSELLFLLLAISNIKTSDTPLDSFDG